MTSTISHLVLLPVVIPLAAAVIDLLVLRQRLAPRVRGGIALAGMAASTACSLALLARTSAGEVLVFHVGGWTGPFGITLVADLLGSVMAVMCQVVLTAGVLYAAGSRDRSATYPSFYPLLLTLSSGLTGAMLTGDLFNFFVFAELVVISGTVLTAISDNKGGTEAAFKYFYMSTLAAVLLLLACGSLYASYGTLNMADLSRQIAAAPDRPLAGFALAMLVAALCIKSAVAPFHFWQPDFHTTAPTPVSALLSSVVVKIGVYGFIRLTTLLYPHQAEPVGSLLVVLGCVGVLFGGLAAVGTHDLKRMLAYSTLAQIGFMLAAIGWGTTMALAAAVVFAVNHSLVKAAMLMLAGAVASRAPVKTASFEVVTGVGRAVPAGGVLFLLGGMALAGMPPMNGFVSKLGVLWSGVAVAAYLPVVILASGGALTLVYVARALQRVWWQLPAEGVVLKPYGDRLVAPALLIALAVLLGVWPQPLLRVAEATGAWLAAPAPYVTAVLGGL
jgi:multicomponent Na+:H+ antiporter subunit D